MKRIKKLLLWFGMLTKRLYKKPTFLALLVLIPALSLGYASVTGGESGVLSIGLACRGQDPLAREIFSDLGKSSNILRFQICPDPQEAETLLRAGKLDAVWLFPEDLAEKIEKFAQAPNTTNAFITILEREDNVALRLSREKLNGIFYPYVAQRVYVTFLRELAPELSHLSDDQLLAYYHATDLSMDLFDFQGAASTQRDTGYLLSPLRGLLGTLILLCALAAGLYYIKDKENGTFAWVNRRWQLLPELGCQMTATLHICAVCLVCLSLCGLAGSLWTELAILLLYSLCCSVFAMFLRQVCGSVNLMGTVLPLVIVAVLVVCPVFFDLRGLRSAQYLLPPTYYINAIYDGRWLMHMTAYTAVLAAATVLIQRIKDRLPRS